MEENVTKVCSKCGRELPISNFSKNKKSKDGHHSYCKDCHKEYNREYNREKPRKAIENTHKMLPVYSNPELAKFHPRELMAELKARGFRWEYMLEPQRKIMFEKV